MGLLDWRKSRTSFADGTSIVKTPAGGTSEIGVSGESVIGAFGTEPRADSLTVKDYVEMRQNDGTVSSLYNILTLPILASNRTIEADEDDANEEQADFIRNNLLEPPHKGGMEIPLGLILADMLRGVLEGFRLFEKVYRIQDGKITYKKLASRDSQTVTLDRAEDGGYGGAHQQTSFKGNIVQVDIPAEKTFLYTYGKDKNFLYGESAFKAAHYHYDIKRKLYYLTNLAIQVGAVPPKVVTGPADGVDAAKKSVLLKAIDKLGIRSTAYLPSGYTLEAFDSARGRIDPLPVIEHHDVEMARSVLAQALMLGGRTGGSGGSYALSKDHTDILTVTIEGIKATIADHINYYVIGPLIDLNFANPAYPEFRFEDMTSDSKDLVMTAFTELIKSGSVSEALSQGIEDRVAETLDIDTEAIQKQLDLEAKKQAKKDAQNPPAPPVDPNGQPVPAPKAPVAPPAAKAAAPRPKGLSDSQWFRPLTPAESKVRFGEIQSKLDAFDQAFQDKAKPLWSQIKDDAVLRLTKLLESGDIKALDGFQLTKAGDYRGLVISTMRDAYEYAKKGAADELKLPSPGTKRDTSTFISQNAQALVDRQFSDLLFTIKTEVLKQLRKNTLSDSINLGLSDILSAVATAFSLYFDNKITLGGTVAIAQAINRGRDDVFASAREEIYAYQYSAILDGKCTSGECPDLDGTVLDYAEYRATQWVPPIHPWCRCIWLAILNDEKNPPDFTGVPDSPGGKDQPYL